jgi:hypothetical protein
LDKPDHDVRIFIFIIIVIIGISGISTLFGICPFTAGRTPVVVISEYKTAE